MPGLPPGPGTAPILQTLAWIRRPAELLEECRSRYGAIFTLTFAGGRKFVMLADPEDVKGVFGGSPDVFLSGRANQTFKPFMGEHSLLVLDGAPHRRHRRLLMPPFQGARMRAYGPLIANVTQQFVDAWPEGRPFSLYDAMKEITLRIIFHAIFGVSDEARALELTRLVALSTGRAPALLNFVPALQRDLGSWSPWGRFLRARRRLDAILDEEIASARRDGGGREDILARPARRRDRRAIRSATPRSRTSSGTSSVPATRRRRPGSRGRSRGRSAFPT
ncbi:MAG: cytochrome P450 [Acidobacteriota bacterium]